MKELLITSGFPRSGSTYLNHSLNLLYYPQEEVNYNRHTVVAIDLSNKILVPFRNPVDAIASWHLYPIESTIEQDINFYIRFYSSVLERQNKVILMDFDKFTADIDYIKDQVFKNFSLSTNRYVADENVKEAMLANDKHINLPRNNKEELQAVKELISNTEGFDKCLELYAQLKG